MSTVPFGGGGGLSASQGAMNKQRLYQAGGLSFPMPASSTPLQTQNGMRLAMGNKRAPVGPVSSLAQSPGPAHMATSTVAPSAAKAAASLSNAAAAAAAGFRSRAGSQLPSKSGSPLGAGGVAGTRTSSVAPSGSVSGVASKLNSGPPSKAPTPFSSFGGLGSTPQVPGALTASSRGSGGAPAINLSSLARNQRNSRSGSIQIPSTVPEGATGMYGGTSASAIGRSSLAPSAVPKGATAAFGGISASADGRTSCIPNTALEGATSALGGIASAGGRLSCIPNTAPEGATTVFGGISASTGYRTPCFSGAAPEGATGGYGGTSVPHGADASVVTWQKRLDRVEEEFNAINAVLREQQQNSDGTAALRERVLHLASALEKARADRSGYEQRVENLKEQIVQERQEREAWLQAFMTALRKTLGELSTSIDHSVADSNKLMCGRLDEAENLIGKLAQRMDSILAKVAASGIPTAAAGSAVKMSPAAQGSGAVPTGAGPAVSMPATATRPSAGAPAAAPKRMSVGGFGQLTLAEPPPGGCAMPPELAAAAKALGHTEEGAKILQVWTRLLEENARLQRQQNELLSRKQARAGGPYMNLSTSGSPRSLRVRDSHTHGQLRSPGLPVVHEN